MNLQRLGPLQSVRTSGQSRSALSLSAFVQQRADQVLGAKQSDHSSLEVSVADIVPSAAPNDPMPFQMSQLQRLQVAVAPASPQSVINVVA